MVVALPANYSVVSWDEMIGTVGAAAAPLNKILDNANWLYGNHAPPLLNLCPIHSTSGTGHQWVMPVIPSADSLDYTVVVNTYASGADNLTLDIRSRVADSDLSGYPGTWTDVLGGGGVVIAHGGAGNLWTTASTTMTLASTVRYLSLKLSGAVNVQLQSITIYPTAMASVAVGTTASGFTGIDLAHIAGAGAAIHTEYFDRAWANVKAVMRDRYQSVLTFANPLNIYANPHRITPAGNITRYRVLRCPVSMQGQKGATVNVRVRVEDNATNKGSLYVYASGAPVAEFVATLGFSDQTATLTLTDDYPTFDIVAEPGTGGVPSISVVYVHIDWRPGD